MLRYLFVDMNSFFASCEQQAIPALRGKPIAVVPTLVDTTCCIAASIEAKAFGVKTGTAVHEARKLCPGIRFIEARPRLYVEFHHRIVTAVESCLHVDHVCSVDEMYGRLMGHEHQPERAAALAFAVKDAVRAAIGPAIRCSIGIAPNAWLAKLASDMQKPDGMMMIRSEQMPEAIFALKLTDLPGIATRMEARLAGAGIHHVHQLCALSELELARLWGSKVHAAIWWGQLRGHDLPYRPTRRRMVGHSHVLPPADRNDPRAYAIVVRMTHRAAARMRRLGYSAGSVTVYVGHLDADKWERRAGVGITRDTGNIIEAVARLWRQRPPAVPFQVGVVLGHLVADASTPLPLFPDQARRLVLADTLDRINRRFGHDALYYGAMMGAQGGAPTRISFTQIPALDEF